MSQAHEVFPRAVQPQFPDVDVPRAVLAAELRYLPVALDAGVTAIGKDPFGFVVRQSK